MKNKIFDFLSSLYCDSWLFMKLTWPIMNFKDNVNKLYKEHIDNNIIYNICKVVKDNINDIIELLLIKEENVDNSIYYIVY